ncbi:MAG: multicomponent Na+:H+ antiporter subunit G [Candidatus Nanohaloarchaea archaeon]|jgi:multicomponent Na+:H+ antiporter subunit G
MMEDIFVMIGLFFLTVGTIGLLRFPGTLNRMHATSKATTLGTGLILVAGAVHFYPRGAALQALIALVFLFITAPTGAHLIARATYYENQKKETGNLEDFL